MYKKKMAVMCHFFPSTQNRTYMRQNKIEFDVDP
jgi:hypothetical protein